MADQVFVTPKEVSQLFPISTAHLAKLRMQKKGPPFYRPPGMRRIVYDVAEFRRWIDGGRAVTENHAA